MTTPDTAADQSIDDALSSGKAKSGQQESRHYTVISPPSPDGRVLIGQDIEIFPGKECPHLASPGTHAYEAKDRRSSGDQVAMLCGRSTVPRVRLVSAYKGIKSKHVMKLIDAGIVHWPADGRQRMALIFDKPSGRRILETPDGQPPLIDEMRLIPAIIQPVVEVLSALKNFDMAHGAVHLGNMFLSGARGGEMITLGECLSSAAFSWQDAAYEMAARAVTKPTYRGTGTSKDDLYALGLCVAMLAMGKNLIAGRSPEQLAYDKIEHGSFNALIGSERIPSVVTEFLRGVLNDDDNERWDIDDVTRWIEGRRLSPKQARVILKAARPLIFAEQKYWDLRALAEAFAQKPAEAIAEIDKPEFALWLKRNFEDKRLKQSLDMIFAKERAMTPDHMLCNMCMALDPHGPVRYKGIAAFPNGFGTALTIALTSGQPLQIYAEFITHQLFGSWISPIFEEVNDAAIILASFEKCRSALTQKMPGYGIERVLYLLNPDIACLSPLLKDHFVLLPGNLLQALDALAKQGHRSDNVFDRHMIAFISVREPKMIDPHLSHIHSPIRSKQVLGILRAMSAIQRRFGTGLLPHLSAWMGSMTAPLVEALNDQDLKEAMSKHIAKVQDKGNILDILEVVDDAVVIQDDAARFARAKTEYARLNAEKIEIESNLKNKRIFGRGLGRQIAMFLSTILAVVLIISMLISRFGREI